MKNLLKSLKSCWQPIENAVWYQSCRMKIKSFQGDGEAADSRLKMRTCLAGLAQNISNLIWEQDRNATLNIFLYIWGQKWTAYAVHDQRSYLMDRAGKTGEIEEIQRTLNCWESFEQSSNFRTTQFSKRIKMESQVHFDLENFFHIKIKTFPEGNEKF